MTNRNRSRTVLTLAAVAMAFLVLPAGAIEIPDVLPDPDTTPPDTTKPVKVFILSGQSNMVGMGRISPLGTLGTLETITKTDGMFPNLIDASNNWTVRNDVKYRGVITAIGNGFLTPGVMGSNFGPELGFGHVMGYYYDEPVIVLKTSQGNRSLSWDCLPPGSPQYVHTDGYTYAGYSDSPNRWLTEGGGPSPYGWYAGKQYDDFFLDESDMGPKDWAAGIEYVKNCQVRSTGVVYNSKSDHTSTAASEPGIGAESSTYWTLHSITNVVDVLDNFATQYPEYAAQGFEIAGFGWWQGHKDQSEPHASNYEFNLVNFINEVRGYYENRYPSNIAPNAPFVIATIAFGGWDLAGAGLKVANAQLAVSGETGNYPAFEGNVKTVECRDFWRDSSISPTTAGYHYNGNAETFYLVGDSMGRAMADLLPAYSVVAGDDMITWSGQPVELDATIEEGVTVVSYAWSAVPDTGVIFQPNEFVEDPTVTITKATDNPSTVALTLVVNDGINTPVADTMTIDVYDNSCRAALGAGLAAENPTDLDANCITDLRDYAVLAAKWLVDQALTAPIPKP